MNRIDNQSKSMKLKDRISVNLNPNRNISRVLVCCSGSCYKDSKFISVFVALVFK